MARSGQETRARILRAAYRLFYAEGFTRVGVDAIAGAADITKRTLYYHFDSKDALVAAVLGHQHRLALEEVRSWGGTAARTPAQFLSNLFEQLEQWAARPDWHGSGFTRLTMELADLPGHPARHAAHRHKAAVEAWLSQELDRLGARHPKQLARQTMLLIEGCLSLILIHGDTGYAAVASQAAIRLANAGPAGQNGRKRNAPPAMAKNAPKN